MTRTESKKQKKETVVNSDIIIKPFERGRMMVMLLGMTPLICNRQSEKTKRELLFPAKKQKPDHRELRLKHDPIEEFRASPYLGDNKESPTYIFLKGGAFKSSACDSAIDSETLKAAQVKRLVAVPAYYVGIYGIPKICMMDVRTAGISRTPDIRTRVIIPEWCALVEFTYVMPLMNQTLVLHLIANGGMTRGVGDARTEKGALDFGQYTIVPLGDPTAKAIMASGGRAVQEAAMAAPAPFDKETDSLLAWFKEERGRREKSGSTTNGKKAVSTEELEESLLA